MCTKNRVSSDNTVSNVSAVHFNANIGDDNVLLPSFVANIQQNACTSGVRALYDTGSKRNFNLGELAEKLKLRTINDIIGLIIIGINVPKRIKMKVVDVPLNVDGNTYNILAIVEYRKFWFK